MKLNENLNIYVEILSKPKNKVGIKFWLLFERGDDLVSKDSKDNRFFSASWMFMSMCPNIILGGCFICGIYAVFCVCVRA